MSKKVFEFDFRGRKLVVENGEMAKQANGAVLVRYGDTVILSTVAVLTLFLLTFLRVYYNITLRSSYSTISVAPSD